LSIGNGSSANLLVAPTNVAAEWSVLGHMLTQPQRIGEIVGLPLEQSDFTQPDTRLIFSTTVERNFAGQTIDAIVVAEQSRDELSQLWSADPSHVASLLSRRASESMIGEDALEHAELLRQLSAKRKLMDACYHALSAIGDGQASAQEISDRCSTEMLQATAGSARRSELMTWMDAGRAGARQLDIAIAAKKAGVDFGVYTGLPFIDAHIAGIAPGELCFVAGEPGAGKTALAWAAALGFAKRQLRRDHDKRVGVLLLSMEMGYYASFMRIVQNLTGIDGVRMREGAITQDERATILRTWQDRELYPIIWNFASSFRLSQMRALIAEGIRKYNTGFIVIDHFRMIETDRRYDNPNQEDEAKVRFIKQQIARDLDCAVMCLAHTVKIGRSGGADARPRLSDLRGSQMISAFADQVGFMWSPFKYASDKKRQENWMDDSDVELEWLKNRFGKPAVARLTFDAERMKLTQRI
jgi:replicative DNA helicase